MYDVSAELQKVFNQMGVAMARDLPDRGAVVAAPLPTTEWLLLGRYGGEQRSLRAQALVAMATALISNLDTPTILDSALRWAIEISGHDQGSIMLLQANGKTLVVRAVVGQDLGRVGTVIRNLNKSVAGWVIRHKEPLYLEGRGASLPQLSRAYTKDLPSSISLPLLTPQGGTLGVVSLNSTTRVARLGQEDVEVLQAMANLVAIAIHDVNLYQSLQLKEQQLQEAALQLVKAQEEERRRVAYDLHDGLAQMLAGTHQRMQAYWGLAGARSKDALQQLESVEVQLKQCIAEVRRIIGDLRPSTLDDFGLEQALHQYLAERQRDTGWELEFSFDLAEIALPPHIETTVFRIVQEATHNAQKHAQSPKLAVKVSASPKWLEVEVRDWGKGFVIAAGQRPAAIGQGVGLASMTDRAAVLGGSVSVKSRPGHGTRIVARLPLGRA